MKDISGTITYKGKDLNLVFNLNVLEEIQEEYETFAKWCDLVGGDNRIEPDAKAVIFGFRAMVNEGIDIANDDLPDEEKQKPMTLKQVGRMLTEIGMDTAITQMNSVVSGSTKGGEDSKNE
ncbi:hypothetical protein [Megamonas hypermegale]|uniref:hypothetical protein n=1 Tax=Megamonas hypermegale TaxID=158847 RepID=UPI0026EAF43E|nr:hypothetical protein [Megamonas hypermegale]